MILVTEIITNIANTNSGPDIMMHIWCNQISAFESTYSTAGGLVSVGVIVYHSHITPIYSSIHWLLM